MRHVFKYPRNFLAITFVCLVALFQNCTPKLGGDWNIFSPQAGNSGAGPATVLSPIGSGIQQSIRTPNYIVNTQFEPGEASTDILFVVDGSAASRALVDSVASNFALIDSAQYPASTRMAVMNMHPAQVAAPMDFGAPYLNDSASAGPGFLSLVSKSSVDSFLGSHPSVASLFSKKLCDKQWFSPSDKNADGQSCLSAALQTVQRGDAQTGLVAFHQIVKKYSASGTKLFRPGAQIHVIFVSNQDDPGSISYYGNSGAASAAPSLNELVLAVRENMAAPDVDVQFDGILRAPAANSPSNLGLGTLGDVSSFRSSSSNEADYDYARLIRDSGGTLMTAEAAEDFVVIMANDHLPNVTLPFDIVQLNSIILNGVSLPQSYYRILSDNRTVQFLFFPQLNYDDPNVFNARLEIDYEFNPPVTPTTTSTTVPESSTTTSTTVPESSTTTSTTVPGSSTTTSTTVPGSSTTTSTTVPGSSTTTSTTVPESSTTTSTTVPESSTTTSTTVPGSSTTTSTTVPGSSTTTSTTVPGGGNCRWVPFLTEGNVVVGPIGYCDATSAARPEPTQACTPSNVNQIYAKMYCIETVDGSNWDWDRRICTCDTSPTTTTTTPTVSSTTTTVSVTTTTVAVHPDVVCYTQQGAGVRRWNGSSYGGCEVEVCSSGSVELPISCLKDPIHRGETKCSVSYDLSTLPEFAGSAMQTDGIVKVSYRSYANKYTNPLHECGNSTKVTLFNNGQEYMDSVAVGKYVQSRARVVKNVLTIESNQGGWGKVAGRSCVNKVTIHDLRRTCQNVVLPEVQNPPSPPSTNPPNNNGGGGTWRWYNLEAF